MYQLPVGFLSGSRPLFLHTLQFPPTLSLVVLAPHPDDFDAIGVTMRFFRDNGNRIEVAVATSGASGVEDGFRLASTPGVKAALRESEQRASCQFFALPDSQLTFLRLTEDEMGHPDESEANLERVRAFLLSKRPDLVFMPHGNDTNAGHQRTYSLFRKIVQREAMSVVTFLNRDPKTIAMRHDLYTVFSAGVAQWKGQLLRFHESQHQRNLNTRQHGIDERVLRVNRQTAAELGGDVLYAEAFQLECYDAGVWKGLGDRQISDSSDSVENW